jgi:spore coat protein JB
MYYDERHDHLNLKYKNEENELNNYEKNELNDYKKNEYNNFENKEIYNYENNFTKNDTKKWDNDIKFDINNININNNFRNHKDVELYSLSEGLNKGNSFKNEYEPYKNYIYKVVVRGDKDELLLKIQELTFRTIDLNLYLDMHPNNMEMFKEFKNVNNDLKKYKEIYEKNYGPLCMNDTLFYNDYKWVNDPWPWMNEGGNK